MIEVLLKNKVDLIRELDIEMETVGAASFQGEICDVYKATSNIHGPIIIKTASKNGVFNDESRDEIKHNKEGYVQIPDQFRPEIFLDDPKNDLLVMRDVGRPLRDILWLNKEDKAFCEETISVFLGCLASLIACTKENNVEAKNIYLDQLKKMGEYFLKADFFSSTLRLGFLKAIEVGKLSNNEVVSFATLDLTQGNILIDPANLFGGIKIIDPKQPRQINGKPTFLGISEVDLGMYWMTLKLNSPDILNDIMIEDKLKSIGSELRENKELSEFYFDLGKIFGCIIIATFPNTIERVSTYFDSMGTRIDNNWQRLILDERSRHIQEAKEIVNKMNL